MNDFTKEELARYGEYCCNDTALTYVLCQILIDRFSMSELKLIDLTLSMFYNPVLQLDTLLLEQHLGVVKDRK